MTSWQMMVRIRATKGPSMKYVTLSEFSGEDVISHAEVLGRLQLIPKTLLSPVILIYG